MAPEVMCRQKHTVSVDYFAVGVMAYECMFGRVSTILVPLILFYFCFSGLTWANRERKSEIIFFKSKFK